MKLPPADKYTLRGLDGAIAEIVYTVNQSMVVFASYEEMERVYTPEVFYALELHNFQLMAHNIKAELLGEGYDVGKLLDITLDQGKGVYFTYLKPEPTHAELRQALIKRIQDAQAIEARKQIAEWSTPSPKP